LIHEPGKIDGNGAAGPAAASVMVTVWMSSASLKA
jgi:hypothetical protein